MKKKAKKSKAKPQRRRHEVNPFKDAIDMTKDVVVVGTTMQVGVGMMGMLGAAFKKP